VSDISRSETEKKSPYTWHT